MADAFPARATLADSQLRQLNALLGALSAGNAFYSRKLGASGILNGTASLEDFSSRTPFTTKAEIVADQSLNPPYGSNLTCPLERYTRYHQTSGSSGAPMRWLDTPESWEWMLGNWTEVYRAANVVAADRIYFAFSFGPFLGFWTAYESALRLGSLCIPGGGLNSAARLRAIIETQSTVLLCTPTYALRLAEVATAEQIDLSTSRVRKIIVAGEPGGSIPAVRAQIESAWRGARVFDHHGMTEVGPVTLECPARSGRLHVIERSYIAEVVDPATGAAVAAGMDGELVLTTLGRTGSPLLRYRTGDLVKPTVFEAGTPCDCGRHDLALEGGILGRVDDMVVVRGVNVFPNAVDEIVRGGGGVAEYQARISNAKTMAELSVSVEPSDATADATALKTRLERAFESALSLRVPVHVVAPGALPRYEMKARRWVKE
ncbi:MAG TPA: AMP-binding protein [Roseimicrobium sp.]|nr:AMP-binding protein [Roseimicrobium sp.]